MLSEYLCVCLIIASIQSVSHTYNEANRTECFVTTNDRMRFFLVFFSTVHESYRAVLSVGACMCERLLHCPLFTLANHIHSAMISLFAYQSRDHHRRHRKAATR